MNAKITMATKKTFKNALRELGELRVYFPPCQHVLVFGISAPASGNGYRPAEVGDTMDSIMRTVWLDEPGTRWGLGLIHAA